MSPLRQSQTIHTPRQAQCTRREALAGLSAAAVGPWALRLLADEQRPNILLISLDTLRASHLGMFGYERDTSPRLDDFAAEAALFARAYSPSSWTCPSHASVLTGVYPPAHQIESTTARLADGWPTLARLLKLAGYSTKAIVSGPMVDSAHGFDQGFDDFDDRTYVEHTDFGSIASEPDAEKQKKMREEILLYSVRAADVVRKEAERWLLEQAAEPWFLFLHFWDIHADYIPPPPYDEAFDSGYQGPITGRIKSEAVHAGMAPRDLQRFVALYDGEIGWTDYQVGRLLDSMREWGLESRTLVAMFSDHGEEFFEHGTKGHAHNLHDTLIHVPLLFRWPERWPGGARFDTPVSLVDLAPTLLDAARVPVPEWMQGRSLTGALSGKADLPVKTLFGDLFFRGNEQHYLLDGYIKLINDNKTRTQAIYNLLSDPEERRNLAAQMPDLARLHLQRLGEWWAESEAARERLLGNG
ncbi:MAG: Arylsulfatase [candidate division BRC1 bacterium ADurb.BinA364]|nr:MAG: Arylsulfatase [candidate division BRC1 bacterium ADurb.BinA364]